MSAFWRGFRRQIFLLTMILCFDAMLAGGTGAVVNAFYRENPQMQSERVFYGKKESVRAADASVQETQGQLALTFDDGPHSVQTKRLLDGLRERKVRATFFLMGQNVAGNEVLVKQMQEDGHLIGNHSYRHIQLTKAGEGAVCEAIEKTEKIIEAITGERPEYLRPPYGDWNEALECRLDLIPVFWSVDSLDWKLKDTEKIVNKVLKNVEDGDIILMHDIFQTSVDAALRLVDELQARGYTFVTVEELLID